jgi:SAM-dependent methyltransferase
VSAPGGDPAARFGPRASDYERHRPSYPRALFDALAPPLAPPPGALVADVGAGTGLFTAALLDRGYRVVAVEPNDAMRASAERRLGSRPGFSAAPGRAEATGLPDGSVDFVAAAQALHWFSAPAAAAELRRIARPPRPALFVWNVGDRTASAFMRAYFDLAAEFAPGTAFHDDESSFTPLVEVYAPGATVRDFPQEQSLDLDGLVGRLRSAASAPSPGEPRHEAMVARLKALFDAHQRDDRVTIAYRTIAYFGRLGG